MQRLKYDIARFMQGRYGNDGLNLFIISLALVFSILNMFIRRGVFRIVSYALIFYALWRMLSRNIWERQKEYQSYLLYSKKYWDKINVIRRNMKDKEHKYFLCPNCHQMARVPRHRGKIEITCPRCRKKFDGRS